MTTTARCGPYICGIDAAMDVVSGKWKSLILWELNNYGVRRFGELRRGLVGAPPSGTNSTSTSTSARSNSAPADAPTAPPASTNTPASAAQCSTSIPRCSTASTNSKPTSSPTRRTRRLDRRGRRHRPHPHLPTHQTRRHPTPHPTTSRRAHHSTALGRLPRQGQPMTLSLHRTSSTEVAAPVLGWRYLTPSRRQPGTAANVDLPGKDSDAVLAEVDRLVALVGVTVICTSRRNGPLLGHSPGPRGQQALCIDTSSWLRREAPALTGRRRRGPGGQLVRGSNSRAWTGSGSRRS